MDKTGADKQSENDNQAEIQGISEQEAETIISNRSNQGQTWGIRENTL